MSRDLNRHQCPIGGCEDLLANSRLLCLSHWRMLPGYLRDAVYAAYDHGAGVGSLALLHAQTAAIDFVEAKLAAKGGTS